MAVRGRSQDEYDKFDNIAGKTVTTVHQFDSLSTKIDEVDSTTTYVGTAKAGTATSESTWRIRKISVSGTETSIGWPSGDPDYNYEWDERTSYTYS